MKKIRIAFVDFWTGFYKYVTNFEIYLILSKKFEIIFDYKDPEYVFYSCFGTRHKKYNNAIKIFFSWECASPDFNYCDYAISFDYISFDDRYLRHPYYLSRIYDKRIGVRLNTNIPKNKFCSFVVSNDKLGDSKRIEFYKKLSNYKHIDSGGKVLNNVGGRVKDVIDFIKDYKFNICFENQSYRGYCTEKIINAFYAGCIPIYYGDPTIADQFNEKAFVNCHKYKSFDEAIEKIKEIDNNDELRLAMLKEPILKKPLENKLEDFINNIFNQDFKDARRRPTFDNWKVFKSYRSNENMIRNRIIFKIKKIFKYKK